MRLRVSLVTVSVPTNGFPAGITGTLVSLMKLCVVDAGSEVKNICGDLCGFKPSLSCAWAGKVPSGRKLSAETKTRLDGDNVEL